MIQGEFQIEADASSASYFHAVILGFFAYGKLQNRRILVAFYHPSIKNKRFCLSKILWLGDDQPFLWGFGLFSGTNC